MTVPTQPRPLDGRALVFGEVLFDHFPDGSRILGGAPFNVAWHLCGFGADPVLVSAVGSDMEGHEILDQMEGWGLVTLGVGTDTERPTGRVVVETSNGDHSFDIVADQPWDRIPEPQLGPGAPGLLYHGTLALRSEASAKRLAALRERYEDTPVFVDLNLRDPWWTRETLETVLASTDWLKVSEEELAELTGMSTSSHGKCEAAGQDLLDAHPIQNVLVTRGPKGSLLVRRDGDTLRVQGEKTSDVLDTVGAGDAFSAVVCLGILQGWDDRMALKRAGRFAQDICRIRGATTGDLSLYERHLRSWERLPATPSGEGLHVLTLSVHGLVRGTDIDLGRDADTGGQVSYVVDQARALGEHPDVDEVTVITRKVEDSRVEDDYAVPEEPLSDNARIVRLPFGPRRYLRKESLWPHLDALLDQLTRWIRSQPRPPDVIHGHYADAGYVGAQLSKLLGVPFVFTGHSLGRVKEERLLADGVDRDTIEERYHITQRIEAEEHALETADLVITSTRQEVQEQFERYDHYAPERMRVIPPGVDLERFSPPPPHWQEPPIVQELARFLVDPHRPLVLAIARADERKNLVGLVRAFGQNEELREKANLAVVAGNRDDVREMPPAQRRVITNLLREIDVQDLYGIAAYPKAHRSQDIPELYRFAAHTKGVFVNAALTEPFGLTLLEAAATGLPVVATNDGGPRDILEACKHGVLVDPLDVEGLGDAILEVVSHTRRWGRRSKSGVSRVHKKFSWASHAKEYVTEATRVLGDRDPAPTIGEPARLGAMDRLIITDVDDTLTGDPDALRDLMDALQEAGTRVGFGIATGRRLEPALEILLGAGVPTPDVLVTASGTEMHYGGRLVRDRSWERQIRYRWEPRGVRDTLESLPGLDFHDEVSTDYRLRYALADEAAPTLREIRQTLRRSGHRCTVLVDHDVHLDILPVRASPGLALRFFGFKWNLEPHHILVAGDSGNDMDMLEGNTLGVVVGNHTPELDALKDRPRVHFAEAHHARGVLQGIHHYDFFGQIKTEDPHPDHR